MAWKPKSYQNKGNWKKGKESEDKFCKFMNKIGLCCKESTFYENKDKHIDFYIGDNTPVDLKGNKHTEHLWIEKKNVWGGKGSIYGDYKFLVVEYADINTYVFYDRVALAKHIEQYTVICENNNDYYCIYTREGNKDQVIKVKEIDIRVYEQFRIQYSNSF